MPRTAKSFINIQGMEAIDEALKRLHSRVRRRMLKDALLEGAEVVREEAERLAPRRISHGWEAFTEEGAGTLRENIIIKTQINQKRGRATVGINWENVRYGHLVEYGHDIYIRGKNTGKRTRKRAFMRPAFDNKGIEAVRLILEKLWKIVGDINGS